MEDAFQLAYEHEIKADAIRVQQSDRPDGGTALVGHRRRWASPRTPVHRWRGAPRGARSTELRPNADSLAPVVARIGQDVEHRTKWNG